jgi:hypothetical protein
MNKFTLTLALLHVAGLTLIAARPAVAQEPPAPLAPTQVCLMKQFPENLNCGLVPVPEQPSGGVLIIPGEPGSGLGGVVNDMTDFQNFDRQKLDLKNLNLEPPKLLQQ